MAPESGRFFVENGGQAFQVAVGEGTMGAAASLLGHRSNRKFRVLCGCGSCRCVGTADVLPRLENGRAVVGTTAIPQFGPPDG